MALEITYWSARADDKSAPGDIISSEQRSLSGSSALSGATPDNAVFVSIWASEKARIRYGEAYGREPTAADTGASSVIGANERLWLTARAQHKVAGIQAA